MCSINCAWLPCSMQALIVSTDGSTRIYKRGRVGADVGRPMEAVRPEVRRATTSFCMAPAGRHSLAAITTYSAKQPPDRVATGCPTASPASHTHHITVCKNDPHKHTNCTLTLPTKTDVRPYSSDLQRGLPSQVAVEAARFKST